VTAKRPFSEVVSLHGVTVLRVCRAVLSPIDADDAWSETFLSALRAYPELPADANVEAWLVTIAHHKTIDLIRKTTRSAIPVADVPEKAHQTSSDGNEMDLARFVAELPERQRYAVTYHYLAGLPYAEVAAVMGGTADAARRAAADGIAKLRKTRATNAHLDATQGTM
jgi:RNA polymerase sigma factor (sigma-70 family)